MSRKLLHIVYLDWVNNFLTIERFAEYYGLHVNEAEMLITLAQTVFENNHPDA